MDGETTSPTTTPGPDELAQLQALYDNAQLRDAWDLSQRYASPEDWIDHDQAILAGRLLSNWGDTEASDRVHLRNFRRHPGSARALLYAGYTKVRRHGPLETLRWLEQRQRHLVGPISAFDRAHLLCLEAVQLAEFRDFTSAHSLLDEAATLSPDDPWVASERADVLHKEDRYDEAVAQLRQALRIRPWYRPAVGGLAHLLQLHGGEDEALELLAEASCRLQSGSVRSSRFQLLHELGRYDEADAVAADIEHYLPRMAANSRGWLAGIRADIAYHAGRLADAARFASQTKGAFFKRMTERLAVPTPEGRRVVLPVPFVRQHHMTCAPATLAAIARFLGVEVDHIALAAKITYDGTPDHEERHWAESLGWTVREFRLTWESAVALLDRGLPFTLATVATRNAHLQAVIGYDSVLGTFVFRDPYHRSHGEALADELLQGQISSGPRAMVFVPPTLADRLAGIELPEAVLFDAWYRLRRALHRHDREAAGQEADALAALAANHRLALWAQRELAAYDGRATSQLGVTRQLLALDPADANLQLSEIALLRRLGRAEDLRGTLQRYASHRSADTLLRLEHITQLAEDAPRADRTLRHAWRLLHWRPTDGAVLHTCANLLWERHELLTATRVYRLAATAAATNEAFWRSYFVACRHVGQTDRALEELRRRHEQAKHRAPWPTCSFFNALDQLERTPEGFAALDEAMRLQPVEVELRLFAARKHANYGERERARELLESSRGRSRATDWRRTAAAVARCEIDHRGALEHWRALLGAEPLDHEAQRETARLLAICEGRDAALAHLRAEVARHPYSVPMRILLGQWLVDASPEERLSALDELLARDPDNAWARRERALVFLAQQRFPEAITEAEHGRSLEPHTPESPGIVGDVMAAQGRWAEARAEYEHALRLHISAEHWFARLLEACRDTTQRRAAIEFLEHEIRRQPFADEAPLPFQAVARTVLSADELARRLETLRRERPDLWQSWAALATQHLQAGKLPEAVQLLEQAVEKFPVLPRLWYELGLGRLQRGSFQDAIAALDRARTLNPSWARPYARLGIAYEGHLQLDAAEHILRLGIAADPGHAGLRCQLADIEWKLGRRETAVAGMEKALFLDPEIAWAWDRLHVWHRDLGQADGALVTIRKLVESRPGDADVWLRQARFQAQLGARTEALRSCEEAIARNSRLLGAHDLRAELLVELGRFDEALHACAPPAFANLDSYALRGRAAWVDFQRGNRAAAIATLRAIADGRPDYYWGWETLCTWYGDANDHQNALTATERLVWINPTSAMPYAHRAMAELGLKRRAAAKDSLRQALQQEPDYLWGAQRLLGLLLEDRELVESERIVTIIRTHAPRPSALRAELRFHLAAGRTDEVSRCLRDLACVPAHHVEEFTRAIQELEQNRWYDTIESTTAPLLSHTDANAAVGGAWTRSWMRRRAWWRIRRVDQPEVPLAIADDAWGALLDHLGEKRAWWTLRLIRLLCGRAIAARTSRWGSMGYALASCKLHRETAHWLSDHRQRPDAAPWMVHNRALSLIALGRWAELTTTLDHALQLPVDHVRRPLVAMRAFAAARENNFALARQLLDATGAEGLKTAAACCRAGAEALTALAATADVTPNEIHAIFERHEKLAGVYANEPLTRPIRREFARAAAKLDGRTWHWLRQRTRLRFESAPKAPPATTAKPEQFPVWLVVFIVLMLLRFLAALSSK